MMKRIRQAFRLLLGKPLQGLAIDGATLLDLPIDSEFDYTKMPPFDLSLGGVLKNAPPMKIVREGCFRVCVFEAKQDEVCDRCGRPVHWLVLELRGKDKWYHLMTMHESRLPLMLSALADVAAYLDPEEARAHRIAQ